MRAESLRLTLSQHCRQGIGELVPRHAHVDESFHRGAGAPRGEARDGVQPVQRAGGDASCERSIGEARTRDEVRVCFAQRCHGLGRIARVEHKSYGNVRSVYVAERPYFFMALMEM